VTDKTDEPWAFLSSGTWSLLGAEIAHPVTSEKTLAANFTNEGGVEGKITFLKNIIGLWLIQECRRSWELEDGRETSYATLTDEAARSEPFASLIDVGDPSLLAPEDMPSTLRTLCARSGQPEPLSRRAIVRCALESLALKYRRTLRELDELLGRKTARLHIIGGGAKNKLLTQMAADACGLPVIAGPAEGTALGNIAIQAIATGALASLAQARKVVAESVEVELYEPRKTALWAEAEARLH
jgi:rhamnulokinase